MKDISLKHPKEQLVEIMTRIYELGLTTPSGGNISMKDDAGNVWVTPSQIDKGRLKPEDIVQITPDGKFIGIHTPTSEYPFHLGIYKARPDVRAVVHAHPCSLVAFSLTGNTLGLDVLPGLSAQFGSLGLSAYCMTGSEALRDVVAEAFAAGHQAVLMENHGVITCGSSLLEAFHCLENLEALATISINGRRLGKVKALTAQQRQLARDAIKVTPLVDTLPVFTRGEESLGVQLIDTIRRSYDRGLCTAVSSCWSVRIGQDAFMVNQPGADLLHISTTDLLIKPIFTDTSERSLSPYFSLHQAIYRHHPDITAICCAMPVHLMAFAISDTEFYTNTIPESYILLREVTTLPFEALYTQQNVISEHLSHESPCILVKQACFIVSGTSLFEVFDRLEVAEFTARSILQSRHLGNIKHINKEGIAALQQAFGR
jgi:L-fuculose-phosphate aldolase